MEKEIETKIITENEIETNILPDYLQKITQLTVIPQNIKYNIKDIHKVKTKVSYEYYS
jgi:hypothetical protein